MSARRPFGPSRPSAVSGAAHSRRAHARFPYRHPIRLVLMLLASVSLSAGTTGCRTPEASASADRPGIASRAPGLMQAYGCAGCHTIPGVAGAAGRVGPPLTAMADRAYVAGVLPNTHDALVRWIRFPTEVNPRTVMPDMGVTEADALDIAAFLATLHARPRSVRMLQGFVERAIGRPVPDQLRAPIREEP